MAVNKIRVNTDSLDKTRNEVEVRLSNIKTSISQIRDDMNVMNASWTGEAHESFTQQIEADLTYLTEVCEALGHIAEYEGKAVTEYNKCEQQVADLIAQIKI